MRRFIIAAALAATLPSALAAPALAQSAVEQQRWDQAQQRYQRELQLYQGERDRYFAAQDRGRGYDRRGGNDNRGYDNRGYDNRGDTGGWRDTGGYDASRDYRPGNYQDRQMTSNDQVYQGSDGKYYCKRGDGTTGLIVGAAAGGVLGNVVDGGKKRTAGTLLGGALGALTGRAIDQGQDIRCR